MVCKCQIYFPAKDGIFAELRLFTFVFYFLHEGAHVKTDINNDLKPALEKVNLNKVCITKHLGTDEKMIDLILERAKEVEDAN